jgi:hypothetical protein
MKKLFSTLLLAATAMASQATDYTTTVNVNAGAGTTAYENATVSVEETTEGKCKVTIKNLSYKYYTQETAVGTIVIDDVDFSAAGIYNLFSAAKGIDIQAGDDESKNWEGPSYSTLCGGSVPAFLSGEIRNGKVYANLVLDTYGAIKRTLKITIGDGTFAVGQIPNSGFEDFHTVTVGSTSSQEPNTWHSFMSATGGLAAFVTQTIHTAESSEVRPGSTGSKSVLVTANAAILGQIPNGTITTGQMNAGAMKAADTKNHAFLDFTNTSLDSNNDPFYTTLDAQPDSIKLWVKFQQGTGNLTTGYPYATVSAALTDGTRYQEPYATTDITNVAARAQNAKIESKDEWQLLSVPFDYDSYTANAVNPKAIFVTISTNAEPGKGSADDKLYVDDVELVYNAKLASVKVNGKDLDSFSADKLYYDGLASEKEVSIDDVEVVKNGVGASVTKSITRNASTPGKATVIATVVSADCKTVNRYSFVFSEPCDGITAVETSFDENASANKIYTLSGQQVSRMQSGNVYLVKGANGKTVKVIKK